MRPTRRGYGALVIVAVAFLLAAQAGARSLNAVAAPALLALGYGWFTLRRRDAPTVTRRTPAPGFPGETRNVRLRVDAGGRAETTDAVGDGLDRVATTDEGYRVELLSRGAHNLGPATVRETDAFGLLVRERTIGGETEALVYPVVEPITPNRAFRGLVDRAGSSDREAFDSLREYVPGDPLRDVHWKSSAKREPGDLVVAQFAVRDEGGVTVAASAAPGHGDAMASAAASVAVYLLDAGLAVGLAAPNGYLRERRGEDHRDDVLDLLARTPDGDADAPDADVLVRADDDGVTIRTDGRTFPFTELLGDVEPTVEPRNESDGEVTAST